MMSGPQDSILEQSLTLSLRCFINCHTVTYYDLWRAHFLFQGLPQQYYGHVGQISFCLGDWPVLYRMFSSVYPLDSSNDSCPLVHWDFLNRLQKHCQTFPGGQIAPGWEPLAKSMVRDIHTYNWPKLVSLSIALLTSDMPSSLLSQGTDKTQTTISLLACGGLLISLQIKITWRTCNKHGFFNLR